MADLERRLLDHGRDLDQRVAPVGMLELETRIGRTEPVVVADPHGGRRRGWAGVALGFAAAIVVALSIPFTLVQQEDRHVLHTDARNDDAVTITTAEPQESDACSLLLDAYGRRGKTFDSKHTTWSTTDCAIDWDGSWADTHLLLRLTPTSPEEAEELRTGDLLEGTPIDSWSRESDGLWVGHGFDRGSEFYSVAVWAEQRFFVVTSSIRENAIALARAVAEDLTASGGS